MKKNRSVAAPAPRLASLATPLPRGERGRRICVARIGAPHGIRGEVKLWPFTTDPLAIAEYGVLEMADGAGVIEIQSMRPARDFLVARLKGITDRTAAEKLRNVELFVPRDRLPAIEEDDEFYYADLVGLAAVDRAGATLGTIVAVHNFGAGDLLELKLDTDRETLLIPFTEATVPELDVAGGRVVIDLPMETPGDDIAPEEEG
jgi:16S rRNA processing protein RimM